MLKKHLTRWSGGTFFGVMESFGLGDAFVSWIRMANLNPTASIVTNQSRSHRFPLERGTCQGCPLSPLLFTLAIEPLAISIRENKLIKPITIDGINHKISLYADDIASFLTDPEQSVPYLLDLINEFGTVSAYTINWQKSDLLLLTADLDPAFMTLTQFNISKKVLNI